MNVFSLTNYPRLLSGSAQIFAIILYSLVNLFRISEGRMICKHRELDRIEVLLCPPEDNRHTELRYCCANNGLLSCCDYNDYYRRHYGPSWSTIACIVVSNCLLVAVLLYWYCCIHKYRDNRQSCQTEDQDRKKIKSVAQK